MPILLLVILALLPFSQAAADVIEKVDTVTYTATATPERTLRQILIAATPIRHEGRRFHGYTNWNIRWNYRWFRAPNGACRITEVTTDLRVTVQLPALSGGSEAQRRRFDTYLDALRAHEDEHVELSRQAAHRIDREIAALPAVYGCHVLEEQADALGHRILAEFREKEKQYDRKTEHGPRLP